MCDQAFWATQRVDHSAWPQTFCDFHRRWFTKYFNAVFGHNILLCGQMFFSHTDNAYAEVFYFSFMVKYVMWTTRVKCCFALIADYEEWGIMSPSLSMWIIYLNALLAFLRLVYEAHKHFRLAISLQAKYESILIKSSKSFGSAHGGVKGLKQWARLFNALVAKRSRPVIMQVGLMCHGI